MQVPVALLLVVFVAVASACSGCSEGEESVPNLGLWNKCDKTCSDIIYNYNSTLNCAKIQRLPTICKCRPGFVRTARESKLCIPATECACLGENMERRAFGGHKNCELTCSDVRRRVTNKKCASKELFRDQCYCKEGFVNKYTGSDICVEKSKC